MNTTPVDSDPSRRPRRALRILRLFAALCALGAAPVPALAECDPSDPDPEPCTDRYDKAREAYLNAITRAQEAEPDLERSDSTGCDYYASPAFKKDLARCEKGVPLMCGELAGFATEVNDDPDLDRVVTKALYCSEKMPTTRKPLLKLARAACAAGENCELLALHENPEANRKKHVAAMERRCESGAPDAAGACQEAFWRLVGCFDEGCIPGSVDDRPGLLATPASRYERIRVGYAQWVYKPDLGTFRDPARLKRVLDGGCRSGLKLMCDGMATFVPAG